MQRSVINARNASRVAVNLGRESGLPFEGGLFLRPDVAQLDPPSNPSALVVYGPSGWSRWSALTCNRPSSRAFKPHAPQGSARSAPLRELLPG
jgi:hypothetical protein